MSGGTFGLPGLADGALPAGNPDVGVPLNPHGNGVYKRLIMTESQMLEDPSDGLAQEFMVTIVGGGGAGVFFCFAGSTVYGHSSIIGGGAGEGIIFKIKNMDITWPAPITVGAGGVGYYCTVASPPDNPSYNGGTSSAFGVSALGGYWGGNSSYPGAGGGLRSSINMSILTLASSGNGAACGYRGIGPPYYIQHSSYVLTHDGVYTSGAAGGHTVVIYQSATTWNVGNCGMNLGGNYSQNITSTNPLTGSSGQFCASGGGASLLGKGGDGGANTFGEDGVFGSGGGAAVTNSTSSLASKKSGSGGSGVVILEWYE